MTGWVQIAGLLADLAGLAPVGPAVFRLHPLVPELELELDLAEVEVELKPELNLEELKLELEL